MTYEKALFILKHGSGESLQTYLEAIEVVENYIKSLENRLRHLLESEYIASFDEKNPFNGEYKKDIHDADKVISSKVISSLEKQIPKKPIYYRYPWAVCPNCGGSVYLDNIVEHIQKGDNTYCEHCGQALDWNFKERNEL